MHQIFEGIRKDQLQRPLSPKPPEVLISEEIIKIKEVPAAYHNRKSTVVRLKVVSP